MKIAIVNQSKQEIGGGWSFINNIRKGFTKHGQETVDWPLADLVLIPSSSMISKELFREIKGAGKKIVLRVDNIPRNSRNRNTGTTRLLEFAQGANRVIYQSEWAKAYVGGFIGSDGPIIYNGLDLDIFKKEGSYLDFKHKGNPIYLYSRYNRDETKRWEEAWYDYQMIHRGNPNAYLVIVGQFSSELVETNFDFFNGERFEFLGIIDNPERMAQCLRGCDYMLATYYNDCFSNTYLEALACGVELLNPNLTGGTKEMLELWERKGQDYFSLERMIKEYLNCFEEVVNEKACL